MIKTYIFEYKLDMNSDKSYEVWIQGINQQHALELLFDNMVEFHNITDEEARTNVSISYRI